MSYQAGVILTGDPAALAHRAAGFFAQRVLGCVQQRGTCFVALSGGSTPRGMHRLLGQTPYRERVAWQETHLFWVDERLVGYGHRESNYGCAREDFLQYIPIPDDHVHPMPVDVPVEQGAETYRKTLKRAFFLQGTCTPRFDVIFLGLGSDGHTASLFPGDSSLQENSRWVIGVKGGRPNLERLTLTLPVINSARDVVFLVSGRHKAVAVKRVFDAPGPGLPAQRVRPTRGRLTWLLDRSAASLISERINHAE